jgi:hypothetical protein
MKPLPVHPAARLAPLWLRARAIVLVMTVLAALAPGSAQPLAAARALQNAPAQPLALLAGPEYQFDGVVYAVEANAVYRATVGGGWERLAALTLGSRGPRYTGAAVASTGPNQAELLLTTSDLRLLRVPLPPAEGAAPQAFSLPYFASDVRALLPSPKFAFDQTLYVVTPAVIFRSTDGGASWSRPGSWGETVRATLELQGGAMLALSGDRHALLFEREDGTVHRLDPAMVNWYGVPAGVLPPNPVAVTVDAGTPAGFVLIDAVTGAVRRVSLRESRFDPALRNLRQAGTVGPEQPPAAGLAARAPESLPSPDGRLRLYLDANNVLNLEEEGEYLRPIAITLGGSATPPRALWWPNSAGFLLLVDGKLYTEQVSGLTARLIDVSRPERLWEPNALRWFNLLAPPPEFEYYFWFDDQSIPAMPLDALLPSPQFDLDATIYALQGKSLHRSTDGGSSWQLAAADVLPESGGIVAAALAVGGANRLDLLLLTSGGALERVDLSALPQAP